MIAPEGAVWSLHTKGIFYYRYGSHSRQTFNLFSVLLFIVVILTQS